MKNAVITAVGHYFPDKVVPNSHFESYLDTTDEWIRTRTGIRERRYLEHGATSDMAVEAARMALDVRGLQPTDIDLLVVATVTPDMMFPHTACLTMDKLGAVNAWGYDVVSACSGFLFALTTVVNMVRAGGSRRALLIGADKMTSIVDMEDRNTCILFGDAAGAFLIEGEDDTDLGIRDYINYCDGSGAEFLNMPGGGSLHPATLETVKKGYHYIRQDGQAVFKVAVKGMADVSLEIMERNSLRSEDVAYLVPHQANLRIISATADRMGLPMDRVMVNIDRYGNTTAATIPTCISEYYQDGRLKKGDNLILAAFGAGFTWGASYIKWALD
ncbi:MAG: ketoacyl-ACP synthase III [Chlorobi bacterium]|nr:ketoacyl-ACP synthase III [Chlorobiota bacterium]